MLPLLGPPDAWPLATRVASDGFDPPGSGRSGPSCVSRPVPLPRGPVFEVLREMVLHKVPLNRQARDNLGQQSIAEVTRGDRQALCPGLPQAPGSRRVGTPSRALQTGPVSSPRLQLLFLRCHMERRPPAGPAPAPGPPTVTGNKMAVVLSHRGVQSEGVRPSTP